MTTRIPTMLIILDGWGYREDTTNNAIANARKPFWDRIWKERPHTLINTSGMAVGLPEGQMGNSEVGHMNLGAGRVVYQIRCWSTPSTRPCRPARRCTSWACSRPAACTAMKTTCSRP